MLNKVDYLNEEDQTDLLNFLAGVLAEQHLAQTPIFPLSAKLGLSARLQDDAHVWSESCVKVLEDHLKNFLGNHKQTAPTSSLALKADNILNFIHLSPGVVGKEAAGNSRPGPRRGAPGT